MGLTSGSAAPSPCPLFRGRDFRFILIFLQQRDIICGLILADESESCRIRLQKTIDRIRMGIFDCEHKDRDLDSQKWPITVPASDAEAIRVQYAQAHMRVVEGLTCCIASGIAAGEMPRSTDSAQVAELFLVSLVGAGLMAMLEGDPAALDRCEDFFMSVLRGQWVSPHPTKPATTSRESRDSPSGPSST